MAPTQEPPSFDDIIQAGRQRKKAEALANEIFGKGKRTSSPQFGGRAKPAAANSLASRISKPGQRSHSSSPVLSAKVQAAISRDADLFSGARSSRKNLSEASNATGNSKLQNGKNVVGKDFSIRGAAGPYVVVGSNFAPGTTAADIQSAMEAITGEMLSCNIITSYPTVIAEMVFADKACAETVISTFNNQRADGRLLHVYLKNGPPTQMPEPAEPPAPIALAQPVPPAPEPQAPRELLQEKSGNYRSRSSNRRASPEFQDGRYGFESKDEMEVEVEEAQEQPPPPAMPRDDRNHEPRNERPDDRYLDDRRERYGYRPGYSRDTRPSRRDYDNRDNRYRNGNDNRRPTEPSRLYSDEMYSYPRSRGRGYR